MRIPKQRDTVYTAQYLPIVAQGEEVLIEHETKDSTILKSNDGKLQLPVGLNFRSRTYLSQDTDGRLIERTGHEWSVRPNWYEYIDETPDTIYTDRTITVTQEATIPFLEKPWVVVGLTVSAIGVVAYLLEKVRRK